MALKSNEVLTKLQELSEEDKDIVQTIEEIVDTAILSQTSLHLVSHPNDFKSVKILIGRHSLDETMMHIPFYKKGLIIKKIIDAYTNAGWDVFENVDKNTKFTLTPLPSNHIFWNT